jgi:hypothetical protein
VRFPSAPARSLPRVPSAGTIIDGAFSAESCLRQAVVEGGFTPASPALRTQRRRTKPLRGGPTGPSPMGIEWPDSRPLDALGGVFGVREGASHGRGKVAIEVSRGRAPGIPPPPLRTDLAGRHFGLLNRRATQQRRFPPTRRSARRSDRPKRRTVALRASVGSPRRLPVPPGAPLDRVTKACRRRRLLVPPRMIGR